MPDTPEVRALRLGANLPQGTDVFVALSNGSLGNGGTELTLTGYARVAVDDWTTSVPQPGESERANTSDVVFASITQIGTADHWAIFDSLTVGVLLNSGLLLDNLGQPVVIFFTAAPIEARFLAGRLVVKDTQV